MNNCSYEQPFICYPIIYSIMHKNKFQICAIYPIPKYCISSDFMRHTVPILSPTALYITLSHTIHHITIYLSCIYHIAIIYLSHIIYSIISLYTILCNQIYYCYALYYYILYQCIYNPMQYITRI